MAQQNRWNSRFLLQYYNGERQISWLLYRKTVPIYWGAPDIGDYFDINGIIQVNSVQEIIDVLRNLNETQNASRDYMSRMDAIKHNFHKVGFLESPDDMLYRKILNMESPLA